MLCTYTLVPVARQGGALPTVSNLTRHCFTIINIMLHLGKTTLKLLKYSATTAHSWVSSASV